MPTGSLEYKDRLFSFLFGNEAHKEWTLSLYNAINGTHYDNPDDISIETIRQVLYMGMHNDVAFIIADQLSLYEQQSTFNPNMPLRMLEYTANLFEKYIKREALNKYGHRQIMLPVPRLVVFYNGTEEKANETTLRLSDAFAPEHCDRADISVTVRMVNINKGHSQSLMERCPPLNEYAWSVDSVRQYKKTDNLESAIDKTLDSMPDSFLIKPFLEQHRAEVKNMLLTEYNEVETLEMFKRDYLVEGRVDGEEHKRLNTIRKRMRSLKMTARQAVAVLEIPSSGQENIDIADQCR
ncbi:MAG: Rpn family recombination-promoting nuclease/putative transposase [Clostridia bacterium]|nr:Rpn family recombination-promoting nuclease/putative transposase [Clostridia bacterium]